jgi:diguanylate cyclase (GGDEF)-like protein
MQFVEALKLRSKLLFIFFLVTAGLIVVGYMGAINIKIMKKNLDNLYFGSLVPVTELGKILQVYNADLSNAVYKAKNSEITKDEFILNLESSIKKIYKQWNLYKYHFKRDEELQYVEYTSLEILNANTYLLNVLKYLDEGKDVKTIAVASFNNNIRHIYEVVNKLVEYEVDIARYERKNFLRIYDNLLVQVGTILLLVILGVMTISYYVFKSIQNDQTVLEVTTKKLKIANNKLEDMSYTDSLTELYNRKYFNLVYDREIKRAKRTKSYITFMMLDIDLFKQYNDTYGHIEGDFALKSVAKVLTDILKRPSDFVFRLGGEEFGLLLVDTDDSNSANLARDICDGVRARENQHKASTVNEFVTISIGLVCCIADENLNEDSLLTIADSMLYKAKDGGRDTYNITTNLDDTQVSA